MSAVGAGTPVPVHTFSAESVKLLFASVDEAQRECSRGVLPRDVELNTTTPFALFQCIPAPDNNSRSFNQRQSRGKKPVYDSEMTVPARAAGESVRVLYHLHNPVHSRDLTRTPDGQDLSMTFEVLHQAWTALPDPVAMGYVCVLDMNPVVQAHSLDSTCREYDSICDASIASVFALGVAVVVAFGVNVGSRWRTVGETSAAAGVAIVAVEGFEDGFEDAPLLIFTFTLNSDKTATERKLLVIFADHPSAKETNAKGIITQLHRQLAADATQSLELLASSFLGGYREQWNAPSCLTQTRTDLFSVPYWCDLPHGEERISSEMSHALLYRSSDTVPTGIPIAGTALKFVAGAAAGGALFNVLYHVHNAEHKENMALNSAGTDAASTYKAISRVWKEKGECGQVCVHNMIPVAAEALDSSGSEYSTVCRASITSVLHLGVAVVVAFGKEVCDRWAPVGRTLEIDNVTFTAVSRAWTRDGLPYLSFKFRSRSCGLRELVVFLIAHDISHMGGKSYSESIYYELSAINRRLEKFYYVRELTEM